MKVHAFKALYPCTELIKSHDSFFNTVKLNFVEYKNRGFYKQKEQEVIFIYKIENHGSTRTGVLLSTDIEEVKNGNVVKHENTLEAKELKMRDLLLERNAMIKPVLFTYQGSDEMQAMLKDKLKNAKLISEFFISEDQSSHFLFEIKDKKSIQEIIAAFKKIKRCYIADGHHRCSTANLLMDQYTPRNTQKDFSKLLSAYFAFDELDIYDYNRVVDALGTISLPSLMVGLNSYCQIKPLKKGEKPSEKYQMTMFAQEEWFVLQWKKEVLKKMETSTEILTDVHLFNKIILQRILGVKDVRSDGRVKYVSGLKGIKGIEKSVNKNANNIGFALYPLCKKDFVNISDLNQTLPPKSTWFEPRMKNGMIVQEF